MVNRTIGVTQQVVLDVLADRQWRTTREVLAQIPHYGQHEYGMRQATNILRKLVEKGYVEHSKKWGKGHYWCWLNIWRRNGHD